MMKVKYDPEVEILYIRLTDEEITNSEEVKAGVIMDYDAAGKLVSFEILDASEYKLGVDPEKTGILEFNWALVA